MSAFFNLQNILRRGKQQTLFGFPPILFCFELRLPVEKLGKIIIVQMIHTPKIQNI
jgi:hypothetical protein